MSLSQQRYNSKQPSEEDPFVLEKRKKARERQRRKRARDKYSAIASLQESNPDASLGVKERELAMQASGINKEVNNGRGVDLDTLPPDEAARRQRIRLAARERQRRHRASVKAKRMAELGLAIVNPGGAVEQTAIGYTINENGQYEAVLANASQNLTHPPPPPPQLSPYPLPHPHATPGQTFSSLLFLALSCSPLLKQHLLRSLRSTNEELSASEPIIAAAFDQWNHSRTLYYGAQERTQIEPDTVSYLRPHPFRDQPSGTTIPSSSISRRPQDDNESDSGTNESNHSDEDEQGGPASERRKSLRSNVRATGRRPVSLKEQAGGGDGNKVTEDKLPDERVND